MISSHSYYVDDLCINLPTKETIQKISAQDIARLNDERPVTANMTCEPNSVIQQDCNSCTCTPSGRLACTSKLCLSLAPSEGNVSMPIERSLSWAYLPELKSDKEPCEPGKKYRYQCNTCACSNKRVPACTTMICLDFFGAHAKEKEHLRDPGEKVPDIHHLPVIHEGEPCTHGVTYRMDCNMCHCNEGHLVCSKKLCLRQDEVTEKTDVETHTQKTENNPVDKINATKHARAGNNSVTATNKVEEKNQVESQVKEHEKVEILKTNTINENVEKDGKEIQKASEEKDNSKENSSNDLYPELPATKKCKPGHLYSKGCQRCFCTNKMIARCTNRPCEEMKGPARFPRDVFPNITPKEVAVLPTLPHQAARCKAGMVYLVDCNVCLCIFNGNLFCQNKLCLAVKEVNRIAAQKENGKSCETKNGATVPEVNVDCITCSCVQGKLKCEPVEKCTPFRRQLHGELNPKAEAETSIDKGGKCRPGMVYKENCNNCYCQQDGSLRCTRKGCLNYDQVKKLQEQRKRLLKADS
ncbi:hypothetical protein CASFOL_043157 [Castilleja foliolosa]|uniref:Pacifastin domain-containing protein n=1 Tax=Castilleja foliolosa TaxID=1961234 RepID=A0ABD3B6N6_9LAMI